MSLVTGALIFGVNETGKDEEAKKVMTINTDGTVSFTSKINLTETQHTDVEITGRLAIGVSGDFFTKNPEISYPTELTVSGDSIMYNKLTVSGDTFLASNLTVSGDIIGDVSGTVSSLSNLSTSDLKEGSNLYYTDSRARRSIQVTNTPGGDGDLSYNTTGYITYTGPSASETIAHFSGGIGVDINTLAGKGVISIGQSVGTNDDVSFNNITGTLIGNVTGDVTGTVSSLSNLTTDNLSEGTTNLYYKDSRARESIRVTNTPDRDGDLSYNNTTGDIIYTGPSASETRAHFSGGTGVTISDGVISIGQSVGTTDDVSFNTITGILIGDVSGNVTGDVTGDLTGNVNGSVNGNAATATKIFGISNNNIVQLDATQTLTNKTLTSPTINGSTTFNSNIDASGQKINCEYINTTKNVGIGQDVDGYNMFTVAGPTASSIPLLLFCKSGCVAINGKASDVSGDYSFWLFGSASLGGKVCVFPKRIR